MVFRIETLVQDIYELLDKPNLDFTFSHEREVELGSTLISHIRDEVRDPDRTTRPANELYVTQFTPNCDRRVWYNVFGGGAADGAVPAIPKERIAGKNRFKFVYGDLIEELVLYLAELAGHRVEHRNLRLSQNVEKTVFTISGRIDAVIDGVLVDVKSMDPYSFDRLEKGTYDDKWGYFNQLGMYEHMLHKEGIKVTDVAILAVNKTNGRIFVYLVDKMQWMGSWGRAVSALQRPEDYYSNPDRQLTTLNGNTVLSTGCSYCPYKFDCYERDGLDGIEVYAYSDGPKFLQKPIAKAPKVPLVTEAYKKETLC